MSPAAQNNQNCDSHPITVHIPTVQHGLFAIKSLLRQAEESTDLALTNLREMNITLAATALECGQNYANIGVKTLDYLTENIDHDLQQNEEAVRLAKAGEALDQRLDEVGDAINRAIGPTYLDANRIYHLSRYYYDILNLSEIRRIADALDQAESTDPEWSEDLRSAHIIQAEALAYHHSLFVEQPDRNPEDEDIPLEDASIENSLATQATDARTAMQDLIEPILKRYDESLPTDISSSIAAVPELAQVLQRTVTPTAGALIGFHITGPWIRDMMDLPEGPEGEDEPDLTIMHISLVHQGRKVIKSILDPYPKGYPANLAMAHATLARHILQEAVDSDIDSPAAHEDDTLERMIETLEQAVKTELHDVSRSDIRHVLETAANHGCPPAAQASMLSAATLESHDLAGSLTGDLTGAWRRTARQEQAQAVIDAGRKAGLDNYALDDLAWTMGFHSMELGIPHPNPHPDQIMRVIRAAEEVKIPIRPKQRMANVLLNHHPHRARH